LQLVTKYRRVFGFVLTHSPNDGSRVASASEQWGLFAAVAFETPRCTFILDGLDECAKLPDSREPFLLKLKQAVEGLATATRPFAPATRRFATATQAAY
jgi:hypothetical protein